MAGPSSTQLPKVPPKSEHLQATGYCGPVRGSRPSSSTVLRMLRLQDAQFGESATVNWREGLVPPPEEISRRPSRPRSRRNADPLPPVPSADTVESSPTPNPLHERADVDRNTAAVLARSTGRHISEHLLKTDPWPDYFRFAQKLVIPGLLALLGAGAIKVALIVKPALLRIQRLGEERRALQEREALPIELQGRNQQR